MRCQSLCYTSRATCTWAVAWRMSKMWACGNGGRPAFSFSNYKAVSGCLKAAVTQGWKRPSVAAAARRVNRMPCLPGYCISLHPFIHPKFYPSKTYRFPLRFRDPHISTMLSTQFHPGKYRLISDQDKHPGSGGMGQLD